VRALGAVAGGSALWTVGIVAVGMLLAGFVKGVTGIGQALITVPVLSVPLGIRDAVLVTVITTMVTNAVQLWLIRDQGVAGDGLGGVERLWVIVSLGIVGIVPGTYLLQAADPRLLSGLLAAVTLVYVAARFWVPNVTVSDGAARFLSPSAAIATGFLQGATGVGGPVLAAYLSARRVSRHAFVHTSSVAFQALTITQFLVLLAQGAYHWWTLSYGLLALLPLVPALHLGERLGRRLGREVFDRAVLVLLLIIATRLAFTTLSG
jgi:uncharacterized protein